MEVLLPHDDQDPIVGVHDEAAMRAQYPNTPAIRALDARREKGENVVIYAHASGCISVGPYCAEIFKLLGKLQ